MALSRYALVWWQGEAAEAYQHRVQERVAALAATVGAAGGGGRGVGGARGAGRRRRCGGGSVEGSPVRADRAARRPWPPPPLPSTSSPTRRATVRAPARGCAGARAVPCGCASPGDLVLASRWVRVDAETLAVVGPGGLWGESLALEVLAVRLRAAARAYAGVEASVSAVLAGVGAGADLAARGGWLTDGPSLPAVTPVPPDAGARRWTTASARARRPRRSRRGPRRWTGPGRRGGAR